MTQDGVIQIMTIGSMPWSVIIFSTRVTKSVPQLSNEADVGCSIAHETSRRTVVTPLAFNLSRTMARLLSV